MTLIDKKWVKLAEDLQFTQVSAIQASAKNWRDGLIALSALLTTVAVIKGPEKTTDISFWGKVLVAGLLGAALLALLIGSLLAMRAAFGLPGKKQLMTDASLKKWTTEEANKAQKCLYGAIASFFIAVPLIAAAIAFSWFDGEVFPAEPAGFMLVEQTVEGKPAAEPICGELVSVNENQLVLKVKYPTGSRETPVPVGDLVGVKIVDECP